MDDFHEEDEPVEKIQEAFASGEKGVTGRTCDVCGAEAWIFGVDIKLCRQHNDELNAWQRAVEEHATTEAGGPWPQTCPRRVQEIGPWEHEEDLDRWSLTFDYRGDELRRTCSFCGSLHPEDFMERLKAGEEVGPTDKSYKAYLGGSGGQKFYYPHLSDDQRRAFVDLINAKSMKIGYPGHFYVLPFFVTRET